MQPIRVLQVFTVLDRGGAETMIMNYYRHIDRSKVQFDFLVHRERIGAYEEEIKALGGRIYRLPPIHPKYFNRYKKQVKAFLEQHTEYQVIHSHLSEIGYFLCREAKKQQVPTVICHAHSSKMNIDLKAPFRWYWKHAIRHMITHQYTCSKEAALWLFGKKQKAIQMNNAVDTSKFQFNREIREKIRERLGLQDKIVLGHVGSFYKVKNHQFLIKVLAELKKSQENVVLVLVGKGKLEEKIKLQAKALGVEQDVIFLGVREDISDLMQAFDLFLFPSLYEGLPVTLIEAQATALNCLVSENVSRAADMKSELVEFLPIKQPDLWITPIQRKINRIAEIRNERQSKPWLIEAQGYGINQEVKILENFYLAQYGKEEIKNETFNHCLYANL